MSSDAPHRPRRNTASSVASAARSIRSVSSRILDADLPPGMWAATANTTSKAPTFGEIRRGSFGSNGWTAEPQQMDRERRRSSVSSADGENGHGRPSAARRTSSGLSNNSARYGGGRKTSAGFGSSAQLESPMERHEHDTASTIPGHSSPLPVTYSGLTQPFPSLRDEPSRLTNDVFHTPGERPETNAAPFPTVTDEGMNAGATAAHEKERMRGVLSEEEVSTSSSGKGTAVGSISIKKTSSDDSRDLKEHEEISDGYIPPPKKPWTESTAIGLKAFWKWFFTIPGFLITLYGLNVVAWGGMLFLILCGAAPAMCSHNTPANHFDGCNDINSARKI
ncbi:hypothetical protein LTR66_015966, partial [Elasticomyces elasticus]